MIEDIKIAELKAFAEIALTGSLREVARQNHIQPSQLSKMVKKMETALGYGLLIRSAQGLLLTPEGEEFHRKVKTILKAVETAGEGDHQSDTEKNEVKTLSIAGPTFVTGSVVSTMLPQLFKEFGKIKLRVFSMTQDQMVESGIRGFFDIAIHVGKMDWPQSWTSLLLGKFNLGLYAGANHKLPSSCTFADVKKQPFVVPTYFTKNRFYYGTDGCPLPIRDRIIGSEASSADIAMEIISNSDQVTFIPSLIAKKALIRGQIKELKVKEWGPIYNSLYLSVHGERVTQHLQRVLVRELKAQLHSN